MNITKKLLSTIFVAAFLSIAAAGCSGNADTADAFSPSDGILDSGYWENITALDFVTLCDYKGISVPSDVYQVTDEAVQSEIDSIVADYASKEQITDRAVVEGDTVNIDYVGRVDGVEFDGGSTGGQGTEVTIGVTQYIDDFLEQLVGHTPGELFDVEVTFPEDYGKEDLNGKDAVFAVTLNHIVETTTPELTDDFVSEKLSSSYGWTTVAEMKADIESELHDSGVANYIQSYLIENTTVSSVPESLLEYQKNSLIDYYQGYADSYGVGLDEFLSTYVGVTTTDELLEVYADDMVEAATLQLIVQAIAEDAAISVAASDVADYFTEQMGAEQYLEYARSYGMPYLKMVVLNQKVMDYLEDNAVLMPS